jgi:hypothetical protein
MAIEERGGKSKDQEFNGERREQYGDGKADYCLDRSRTHGFEEQVGQLFSPASYPLQAVEKLGVCERTANMLQCRRGLNNHRMLKKAV